MLERIVERTTVAESGIVSLEKLVIEHPDGARAGRNIVRHPGGCVIIPVDGDKNVYLVKQYRVALETETLELPAGKLEKGEEPLSCAIRELKEETGISADIVRYVTSIYPSPGFCDEVLHIYYAGNIRMGDAAPDEGEFVQTVKMPLGEVLEIR